MDISIDNVFRLDFNLPQYDITIYLDSITQLCKEHYFDGMQGVQIQQLVNKVRHVRAYHGTEDHPSTAYALCNLGNMIIKTSSSYLALPFFMEQLRIEKYYLGEHHPDLASILYSIGQIYETYDKLREAEKHLTDAFCLLNQNQRKGKLYVLVTYRIGIVNYRKSSFENAKEYFDIALVEQQAVYQEFDPKVAEMRINIGKFQLELGKLQDSMDNFLEALIIARMAFGNNHFKVAECIYLVGLIHEARADYEEALNVFNQALNIMENSQDDDGSNALVLLLLHRIALVHASLNDADNSNDVLHNMNNILSIFFGHDAKEIAFSMFGYDVNYDIHQIAAAAA